VLWKKKNIRLSFELVDGGVVHLDRQDERDEKVDDAESRNTAAKLRIREQKRNSNNCENLKPQ